MSVEALLTGLRMTVLYHANSIEGHDFFGLKIYWTNQMIPFLVLNIESYLVWLIS